MEMDRVEFMIAHDGLGAPCIHEFAHDLDDGAVLGTTVNEVAQENDLTIWLGMQPSRTIPPPAKVSKSNAQLLGLTVDVGNYVGNAQCAFMPS